MTKDKMEIRKKDYIGVSIFLIGCSIVIIGLFTDYFLLVSGYGVAIAAIGGLIMDKK